MANLRVIILIGPPGAGKGTQAELLSEKLNLSYVETSKILEERFRDAKREEYVEAEGVKYSLADEKKLWERGILCSPPFVVFLMKQEFQKLFDEGKSLLLAGSPRTLYEGEHEIPFLEKLYGKQNMQVILIELSAEQSRHRNTNRRICELMRHPTLFIKETENLTICPLDGSKLVKRTLDDPNIIDTRLKEYQERTFPLVDYLRKEGLTVQRINGDQPVEGVFRDILKALE